MRIGCQGPLLPQLKCMRRGSTTNKRKNPPIVLEYCTGKLKQIEKTQTSPTSDLNSKLTWTTHNRIHLMLKGNRKTKLLFTIL